MIKAAAYLRKSTSGADGSGVERQEESFYRRRLIFEDPNLLRAEERRVLQEFLAAKHTGSNLEQKTEQLLEHLLSVYFFMVPVNEIASNRKRFNSYTKSHSDFGEAKMQCTLEPLSGVDHLRLWSQIANRRFRTPGLELLWRNKVLKERAQLFTISYRGPGENSKWEPVR